MQTDARPFRPNAASTWDAAVADRARIETVLQETLRAEGVTAAVIPSEDGIYPPSVSVQAWMSDGSMGNRPTLRSLIRFIVTAKTYYRAPVVRSMHLARGPKTLELNERPNISDGDVAAWTRHALGRAPRPASYRPWRDAFLAFAAGLKLARAPHLNTIEKRFRSPRFNAGAILMASGFGALYVASQLAGSYGGAGIAPFFVVLAVILFVAAFAVGRGLVQATEVPPQPAATAPRRLVSVDEWHGIATGLAEHAANFERYVGLAIQKAVSGAEIGMAYKVETVHHVTPNGYEARPRHVLQRGQAEVHLDVHGFGEDLFVGWNAYLNWRQWAEGKPVSTRKSGAVMTSFVALEPGFYVPNQLDLIDLNCLTELVHRCVKSELESLIKAANIEQEVDFEIFRGDRGDALDRKRHGTEEKERGGWQQLLRFVPGESADTGSIRSAGAAPAPTSTAAQGSGLKAAITVVAVWFAIRLLLSFFVGIGPSLDVGGRYAAPYFFLPVFAESFALAVGAMLFAGFSVKEGIATTIGSLVLGLVLAFSAAQTMLWLQGGLGYGSSAFALSLALYALVNVATLLVPLALRLPALQRPRVFVLCGALACLGAYLTRYAHDVMYIDRSTYQTIFAVRMALLLALIGYWLPGKDRNA